MGSDSTAQKMYFVRAMDPLQKKKNTQKNTQVLNEEGE